MDAPKPNEELSNKFRQIRAKIWQSVSDNANDQGEIDINQLGNDSENNVFEELTRTILENHPVLQQIDDFDHYHGDKGTITDVIKVLSENPQYSNDLQTNPMDAIGNIVCQMQNLGENEKPIIKNAIVWLFQNMDKHCVESMNGIDGLNQIALANQNAMEQDPQDFDEITESFDALQAQRAQVQGVTQIKSPN